MRLTRQQMSCEKQNLATVNEIVNEIDFKVEKIKFRTIVKSLIIFSLNSETVNYNFNSICCNLNY